MALNLDYDHNTYLAVTLSGTSPYYYHPGTLASAIHGSLSHVGQVGQMQDVQLFAVPNLEWEHVSQEVLDALGGMRENGVVRVDVQKPATRAKRGGDEL